MFRLLRLNARKEEIPVQSTQAAIPQDSSARKRTVFQLLVTTVNILCVIVKKSHLTSHILSVAGSGL